MTDAQIARKRLHDQHLLAQPLSDVVAIVQRLGAVQCQDYPNAKWAIGLRGRDIHDSDVERAFSAGAIVRLHILRPTWHFVAAADVRWLLALTAPRVAAAMGSYNRNLELDRNVFRKSNAALTRALRDGKQLTRAELSKVLERARIGALSSSRVGQLLLQAELDGVVCSGAQRGKLSTYALLDERVPLTPARDLEESLLDLTCRYFSTRGPASPQDYAWWSGLTVPEARRGLEAAQGSLQSMQHNGRTLWFGGENGRRPSAGKTAHLLPNYDELFVGLRDRGAFADRVRKAVTNAHVDALMGHVVVVDGQLVGGWRRTLGKTVDVDIDPMVSLAGPERKLIVMAAERFAQFHGLPAQVAFRSQRTL